MLNIFSFLNARVKILTLFAFLFICQGGSISLAENSPEQMTSETYEIQTTLTTDSNSQIDTPSEQPNQYFTIQDSLVRTQQTIFSEPITLLQENFKSISTLASSMASAPLPLTRWILHSMAPEQPKEKYDRKSQFGTWVNDPNDNTCFNTRAKVLIRDSQVQVGFKANNRCVVESGLWNDPYTGRQFTSSRDIQIDHVVPLKHAYTTGAFRWDYRTRCHYANFVENSYHLLSVNSHENMSKGDRSPDQYMPPNSRVACSYLQRWLEIKLTWNLVLFPNEVHGITTYIQKFHCNPNQFIMDIDELTRQRRAIGKDIAACVKRSSGTVNQ